MVRYYVLNNNKRWVRVNRCGYDGFTFKGQDNIIYKLSDYQVKEIYL